MPAPRRAKRAVNVSIQSDLLDAVRRLDINLSATLEAALQDQLRQRRREEWLVQNGEAIDAYNRDIEEHGTFSDSLRAF
jgi:antitoxin CcdA